MPEFTVFILCVAFLLSLLWVISLKPQIGDLRQKVDALALKLQRLLKDNQSSVEVSRDQEVYGRKPPWVR